VGEICGGRQALQNDAAKIEDLLLPKKRRKPIVEEFLNRANNV
jgi:hypothetical protein